MISLQSEGLSKSLLQHHSWKASILWRSAFFMVQLSHPYRTTVKTIALTRRNFAGKVVSLLFKVDVSIWCGGGQPTLLSRSWRVLNFMGSQPYCITSLSIHIRPRAQPPHHLQESPQQSSVQLAQRTRPKEAAGSVGCNS